MILRLPTAGWLAATLVAGCGGARAPVYIGGRPATEDAVSQAERARADGGKPAYTRADAEFMSGMIGHHAQAVLIAGWAPSHGASPAIQRLCERVVVGQGDEIALMQRWLRDRNEPVPDADPSHYGMAGMDHVKQMPGMLSAEQLRMLDQARGPEFDRLWLTYMIQHHEGAITMVDKLMGSAGAAQDEMVFKLASDIYADQTTEIDFMTKMLQGLAKTSP